MLASLALFANLPPPVVINPAHTAPSGWPEAAIVITLFVGMTLFALAAVGLVWTMVSQHTEAP